MILEALRSSSGSAPEPSSLRPPRQALLQPLESGLGALPHNGAVIGLVAICGLTHHHGYLDILVVAVAGPLLALGVLRVLGTTVGSFRAGSGGPRATIPPASRGQ